MQVNSLIIRVLCVIKLFSFSHTDALYLNMFSTIHAKYT